jgi:sulfur-oxidizing protein SoxY
MDRRIFIKASLATAQIGALAAAGLLAPRALLGEWPSDAFHAETLDDAVSGLIGNMQSEESDKISIKTPDPAENGAVVPIDVRSDIPDTEAIYLFGAKNPFPALASFELTPEIDPGISCRVKLGASGDLVAVVRAGGQFFSARVPVEVVAGGCDT